MQASPAPAFSAHTLQTLDTIVGVTFIFLLFSLVVSAAQEDLAAALRLRGRALKTGLDSMLKNLGGDKLAADFWAHGFVASLQPSGKPPSYMPSTDIAAALLHIVAGNQPGEAVDVATLPAVLKGNTGLLQRFMSIRSVIKPGEKPAKPAAN